jgi:hypothetical protein
VVTPGLWNSAFAVSTKAAFALCIRISIPRMTSPSG